MTLFKKAERRETFIKVAITGVAGSGKTYSALRLARGLVGPKGKIAFIDTENRSATLYSDLTEFDHLNLAPTDGKFNAQDFLDAIQDAEKAKYDCLIIDSASHLWQAILDRKTDIDLRGGNQYTNWAEPTKKFNESVQAFLQSRMHVISCMRSKTDYILETNEKGKQVPRKVGLAPVMRDGIEYEFTTVFDVMTNHHASTSKDRTNLFTDKTFQITEKTGEKIVEWLATATVAKPQPDVGTNQQDKDYQVFFDLMANIEAAKSETELNEVVKLIKKCSLDKVHEDELRKAYKAKKTELKPNEG